MSDCAIENVITNVAEFQPDPFSEPKMVRHFVCGDCDASLETQPIPRHRRIGGRR
ncbi:hypothetical protein [Halomarina oriensis]|uniref:Uncharacterized protein n=1 Tax=Halomarina oriensis TaxID=671145 RepID=A0A6B0GS86_9EURY|nr:hypothetical protein [Halomarina oriensis]MWG36559.1 hypothetical protein [Halomarina oriensis]